MASVLGEGYKHLLCRGEGREVPKSCIGKSCRVLPPTSSVRSDNTSWDMLMSRAKFTLDRGEGRGSSKDKS